MNNEKQKMFQTLNELSFVMDDLRLYLDTHPCDAEALAYYAKVQEARSEVLAAYTANFGPIYQYMVDVDNGWSWGNDPWPWEGVC